MGPVNARPLQDVKLYHDEGNCEERPGRFLTTRAPIGQHVKMFRQIKSPPGHVKEKAYPKKVNQVGDVQRYGGLKAIKKDETIFAAYEREDLGGLMSLTRYQEQMRENVRKFDMKRSTDSWNKI